MKERHFMLLIVFMLFIAGCEDASPNITEEEAKLTATEQLSMDVKITSIDHEDGQYIVNLEIDPHCEFGSFYIDDQSGEIVSAEESAC